MMDYDHPMKIHFPTFWSQDSGIDYSAPVLHLHDLLPRVGQTTSARFDQSELIRTGETIQVIWCPPVSDLNGWDGQPSEIAQSYLLTAKVVGTAPSGLYRYELEILTCEQFVNVLRALVEDLQTQQNFIHLDRLAWDEVSWAGSATVEEFTYLTASTPHEAFMELIVKVIGNEVIGLFSLHIDPGGVFCRLGSKRLAGSELTTVKRTLALARPLHDILAPYLA